MIQVVFRNGLDNDKLTVETIMFQKTR